MENPKMYSLSTVGIVKHYNQDYLLHEHRTDFTGNNGVGKSILADLIQLIFIHDDSLIEFGTDSTDKEGRSAYTLPKDTNEGYAFINIEVSEGAFVTIGVCIPNKRGKSLKPFLILKELDLDKNIKELTFSAAQLPFHKNFVDEGVFLSIEQLARHFRDKHGLCLQYFVSNDDKNRYYSFLYKKEILSINLGIRSNLKSFAKIVQSFSRAKTLNIKSSKSLKDFIFEESEKDYQELFLSHKKELEKQIQEYKSLEKEIEELEHKQAALTHLKELEEEKKAAQLTLFKFEIFKLIKSKDTAASKCRISRASKEEFEKELTNLLEREQRLVVILSSKRNSASALRENISLLRRYKEYSGQIEKLKQEIESLERCAAPDIEICEKNDVNSDDFQTQDIIKRIEDFKEIYHQYGSVSAMLEKVEEQRDKILRYRNELQNEIKEKEAVLSLIQMREEGSLLSRVIEDKKSLSVGQEAVVLGLIKTHWGKPSNPSDGTLYTETLNILSEENIIKDNDSEGYYLRMGHLNRFVPALTQPRLFDEPEKLDQAVNDMEVKVSSLKAEFQAELAAVDNFERGVSFQAGKIRLDYKLDQRLKDFTAYQHYETTAVLISTLNERFEKIALEIQNCIDKQSELGLSSELDPTKTVEFYEADLSTKNNNIVKISSQLAKENSRINSLRAELIPTMESRISSEQAELDKYTEQYDLKLSDFNKLYADENLNLTDNEYTDITSEILFQKYLDAKEKYSTEYKLIVARFEDTSNDKNPEVNDQIAQLKYQFHILEQALLGSRTKHVDNISEKLRDLNRSRLNIVETIFETMLEIFSHTGRKFNEYKSVIAGLNDFFKGKIISKKYYFQLKFDPHKDFTIDWIYKLQDESASAYKSGEIAFSEISVESFVEDFFKKATGVRRGIKFSDLLDPRTYFELDTKLENEAGNKQTPGSTGETYTALVLLGIGRLSKVQTENKKGIKFIILEETANLDSTNFGTFPELAKEHGYQIITMTPKPYGADSEDGWILHHLIPGIADPDINFPIPSSYVKTNKTSIPLVEYFNLQKE